MRATFALIAVVVATLINLSMSALAAPAVSNVQAVQRPGSNLVDITYNLSGGNAAWVSVEISSDNGTTYTVPATSLTGHVGASVAQGSNRKITWNAGADWANQYSAGMKVKVTASDTPPAPAGMALIPAGSFEMGDLFSEGGSSERPVHTVFVSAFYMDRYEVTKALWDEVATWAAANGYDINTASASGRAANHPAYFVTWFEAVKWCNARSQKENLTPCYTVGGVVMKAGTATPDCNFAASGYRLPTEAEWEKAARGGLSGKRFPWGDTISHSQANYYAFRSSSFDVSSTSGYHPTYDMKNTGLMPYSSPVGSFAPNAYGLHDMVGNMSEWCWDWYLSGYYLTSPVSDPRGPTPSSHRVHRGGSWTSSALSARTTTRGYEFPFYNNYDRLGLRCVRSSVP